MSVNKFSIEIIEMDWLYKEDIHSDLCAHGKVKVTIGEEVLSGIKNNESWTLTAMALFLLRTLEQNHTKENQVSEYLIPCCGHFFVLTDDMDEVYVGGCGNGIDWEVIHVNDNVKLTTDSGNETLVDFDFYKSEVLKFTDCVEEFFHKSGEKNLPQDDFDLNGYLGFWKEWKIRRNKWK